MEPINFFFQQPKMFSKKKGPMKAQIGASSTT